MIDVNTLFGFWPKRKVDSSLDTLLRLMAEKDIRKACTLSTRGIFFDFKEGNRETLQAARKHEQLIPVGTLNPCRWLGCMDEARRLIDEGVRLLRFFPQYQEWNTGQAPFHKLLDEVLAPSGVALMLPACEGISAIGRMAKNIPNTIIIEGFKYDGLAEAIVVCEQAPNVHIETHLLNATDFVANLRQEISARQMVFGTYTPLTYIETGIAQVEASGATEEEKSLIYEGNIARILEAN